MSAIGGEKTKHHQAKQAEMNLVKMVGVQMVMCSGQARQGPLIAETVSGKVTGLLYLLHGKLWH